MVICMEGIIGTYIAIIYSYLYGRIIGTMSFYYSYLFGTKAQ